MKAVYDALLVERPRTGDMFVSAQVTWNSLRQLENVPNALMMLALIMHCGYDTRLNPATIQLIHDEATRLWEESQAKTNILERFYGGIRQ